MIEIKYIIVGSDNFWYSCCANLEEVKEEIEHIKKDVTDYADNESGVSRTVLPKTLYTYKVKGLGEIDLTEDDKDKRIRHPQITGDEDLDNPEEILKH